MKNTIAGCLLMTAIAALFVGCSGKSTVTDRAASGAGLAAVAMEDTWVVRSFNQQHHEHRSGLDPHIQRGSVFRLGKLDGKFQIVTQTRLWPSDNWRDMRFEEPDSGVSAWLENNIGCSDTGVCCSVPGECLVGELVTDSHGVVAGANKQVHIVFLKEIRDREIQECDEGKPCLQISTFCVDDDCEAGLAQMLSSIERGAMSESFDPIHKGTGHAHGSD